MRRMLNLGLWTLFLLVLAVIGMSWFLYVNFTRAAPECQNIPETRLITPQDAGMPVYEDVTFPAAEDGTRIYAYFIPVDDPDAPSVIIAHGTGACRRIAASLEPAQMLHDAGINALVIDLRNMGDSERTTGRMAYGSVEYRDVIGAVDWLIDERGVNPDRIGVFGYSMGGATVFVAMGRDERIRAGWLDSTYFDLRRTIEEVASELGVRPLVPLALTVGRVVYGDNPTALSPMHVVDQIGSRPVYLVHGTRDSLVDYTNLNRFETALSAQNIPHETWTTESGHVESLFDERAAYRERLTTFFTAVFDE